MQVPRVLLSPDSGAYTLPCHAVMAHGGCFVAFGSG